MKWLSMIDFSLRHRVSLSTLRRRIKANAIEYKMENGRYFLKDDGIAVPPNSNGSTDGNSSESPEFANRDMAYFIQELKKAYGSILSEKEEIIMQLRKEIEDLRRINLLLEKLVERTSEPRKNTFENELDL